MLYVLIMHYMKQCLILVFTTNNYAVKLSETNPEFYMINQNYKSSMELKQIKCPESEQDVSERVSTFLSHIIKNYKNTNYNILFASHAATLAPLIKLDEIYPLGGLTKIYDNNQIVNQPINY